MEEGKAGKWRNEGGQAGRGEGAGRAWSEGGREDREGDAGRGRAWSERGSEDGQGGR